MLRGECALAYNGYVVGVIANVGEQKGTAMSYNPIFDAMRQAREDANAAHRRIDEDTEDSAEFLFGMGLFVGAFAVVFACIAAKDGGWFMWVAAAVVALVSGLMFFASYRLFKGEGEDGSEDNGSDR